MRAFLILTLMLPLFACSLKRTAVRGITPLFHGSSELLTREGNWQFFREASPGNLKFMELLYLQDPENLELLGVLIKGYAGYAFGVSETLAFGDELAGKDQENWKKEAIFFYTRALDYGMEYFQRKGVTSEQLVRLTNDDLAHILTKRMGADDLLAVLYMAQAWGSLINLQKDNIVLVSQVPKVKTLFDWVCNLKPDIDHGVCDLFYAQYEASRPRMLGGNPEKARELYFAAFKKYPRHLLLRLSYIQFLLLPSFEQEKYEELSSELKIEFAKWESSNRDELKNKSEYKDVVGLNLFNAIAKKRFELIENNKKSIF